MNNTEIARLTSARYVLVGDNIVQCYWPVFLYPVCTLCWSRFSSQEDLIYQGSVSSLPVVVSSDS